MAGQEIRIIIVEDEWIISDNLKKHLQKNENYLVVAQECSYENALVSIKNLNPDLALVDINLKGEKTGIDVGRFLNKNFPDVLFIYLTSIADQETIEKAKETYPSGYLTKPFNYSTVQSSIEIAIHNFRKWKQPEIIELEDGKKLYRLDLRKIKYIVSESVYLDIYLTDSKICIRSSLSNLLKRLPCEKFVQINRSTIVNRDFVTEIKISKIVIDNVAFKVSRAYSKYFQ
ncbi:MAG TPA: response regulator [Prolixibacteraceae bacterium]|nr:response regulator [Prolixibacteraceae bacterium]